MSTKKHTSKYLTEEAINLIHKLALKLGVSQNSVVELAVRDLAKKEDISGDGR